MKKSEFDIGYLEETCILSNKITENFTEIPIYWYDQNVHQKYRTTIVTLEIITDILSKKFPSFKTQIHNLLVSELNKVELTNTNLEDISNLSREELLELYKKEHEKVQKYEAKNKSNSLEETEKLYDKYMNESELFRNEIKRINCELFKEFIDNYIEGNKINTSKIIKEQFRSTSSIDLGNIGENFIKELIERTGLLDRCGLEIINTSKVAHQSDLWLEDKSNNIKLIIESKNKLNVDSQDIRKFSDDIIKIKNEYINDTIVPIFVSLSNEPINKQIGTFSINNGIIYLTNKYISSETFELIYEFYKNINNKKEISNDFINNTKETFNSIKKDIKDVHTTLNKIESKIDSNPIMNNTSLDKIKEQISKEIIKYIESNKDWTKKKIIGEIDKKHIIFKSNVLKTTIIKWYNEHKKLYKNLIQNN